MRSKIKVHEKVLGHLSRGLYRSPASALRELVSNAWDADARIVRINTNFPGFFQLSVEDDGRGFTRDEFAKLMDGGIGNSLKRPGNETTHQGRPLIGRLGIGLLGIAQICGSFTVASKTENGKAFKARVTLYDLLKKRLDSGDGVTSNTESVKEVDIGEYEFKTPPQTRLIYGNELTFHGYIIVQEGSQLHPDELRGILIRIKNVAIGYYDPSMLDYRFNEGPRSRWVTGEIFVDKGLEDALNIDRDSFNRFHPEYRALQQFVHEKLQTEVFPEVYKQIEVRSDKKAKKRAHEHQQTLRSVVSEVTGSSVSLKYAHGRPNEDNLPVARIQQHKNKMEIVLPNPESLKAKKKHRVLFSAVLSIFEVAVREKTHNKQREKFAELLEKLLARW
jgi:hypothetical protein